MVAPLLFFTFFILIALLLSHFLEISTANAVRWFFQPPPVSGGVGVGYVSGSLTVTGRSFVVVYSLPFSL